MWFGVRGEPGITATLCQESILVGWSFITYSSPQLESFNSGTQNVISGAIFSFLL